MNFSTIFVEGCLPTSISIHIIILTILDTFRDNMQPVNSLCHFIHKYMWFQSEFSFSTTLYLYSFATCHNIRPVLLKIYVARNYLQLFLAVFLAAVTKVCAQLFMYSIFYFHRCYLVYQFYFVVHVSKQ